MSDSYFDTTQYWYKKARELEAKLKLTTDALKYYGSKEAYSNAECDKLNAEDGFFPYDANSYDIIQKDKEGNLARKTLEKISGKSTTEKMGST